MRNVERVRRHNRGLDLVHFDKPRRAGEFVLSTAGEKVRWQCTLREELIRNHRGDPRSSVILLNKVGLSDAASGDICHRVQRSWRKTPGDDAQLTSTGGPLVHASLSVAQPAATFEGYGEDDLPVFVVQKRERIYIYYFGCHYRSE